MSGCNTTSYPFGKGKVSALSVLMAGDCPRLHTTLESTAMHFQLMEVVESFPQHFMGKSLEHQWQVHDITCTSTRRGHLSKWCLCHLLKETYYFMFSAIIFNLCGSQLTKNHHQLVQTICMAGSVAREGSPVQHTMMVHQLHHFEWMCLVFGVELRGVHVVQNNAVFSEPSTAYMLYTPLIFSPFYPLKFNLSTFNFDILLTLVFEI